MFPDDITARARKLLNLCEQANLRLATAESCTGGLIAGCITEIAGASAVFERGYVTYSNEAKITAIGVDGKLIATHGAVSEPVARSMTEGVLARAPASLSAAVTGIAGPGGDTPTKPVGLVYIGAARKHGAGQPGSDVETLVEQHVFQGDRAGIRLCAVRAALDLLIKLAQPH